MTSVRLARIESYSAEEAIDKFVVDSLSRCSAAQQALNRPSPLVVIKPNWIQESHEYAPDLWLPVITNPALIIATVRAIDQIAVTPTTVCICDAPHTYADVSKIQQRGDFIERIEECRRQLRRVNIEVLDLRREVWIRKDEVVVERRRNPEDPRGYVALNLGRDSLFYGFRGEGRYYGADYDEGVVNSHHHGETQEYLIAGTPSKCDLFINLPKLKTHKKTGITCCLKNLVGINGDKNWLPHHTCGYAANGGDEYPQRQLMNIVEARAKRIGRSAMRRIPVAGNWLYRQVRNAGKTALGHSEKVIRNGNWSGNDTCWRMALDLNRALRFGNADGSWREVDHPKAYFSIVDGIIGGEGNGPICPDPVESHVLVAGENPAEIDAICSRLMGFDPRDFPIVRHAFDEHRWPIAASCLNDVSVYDERVGSDVNLYDLAPAVEGGFRPHFGWANLKRPERSAARGPS